MTSTSAYLHAQASLRADPKTWVVTGAAGFIGGHLVEKLLQLDQRVVAIDNFATGFRSTIDAVGSGHPLFTFHEGDICDADFMATVCAGADVVLHQAALGSVPRSIKDPQASHRANVDGFITTLIAAKDAGVKRVVYASSSSVYGDDPNLPKVEHRLGKPLSPYAATKAIDEVYADVFQKTYGLQSIGLRYFNVFGPRQDKSGPYAAVIPVWAGRLLEGTDVVINGDGETSRDFCFVDNAVQANILAGGGAPLPRARQRRRRGPRRARRRRRRRLWPLQRRRRAPLVGRHLTGAEAPRLRAHARPRRRPRPRPALLRRATAVNLGGGQRPGQRKRPGERREKPLTEEGLMRSALWHLQRRALTEAEVRERLKRKASRAAAQHGPIPEGRDNEAALIDRVVERLHASLLLNDSRRRPGAQEGPVEEGPAEGPVGVGPSGLLV